MKLPSWPVLSLAGNSHPDVDQASTAYRSVYSVQLRWVGLVDTVPEMSGRVWGKYHVES